MAEQKTDRPVPVVRQGLFGKRYIWHCQNCGGVSTEKFQCIGTTLDENGTLNYCPECGQWVCGRCYVAAQKGDFCLPCAKKMELQGIIIEGEIPVDLADAL